MKDRYNNLNSSYVSEYQDSDTFNTEQISFPGVTPNPSKKNKDDDPMDRFK